MDARAACLICLKQHDIWKCSKFKGFTYEENWRVVRSGGLCKKCLEKGHISKECPKVIFKCHRHGCRGNHHTPTSRIARDLSSGSSQRDNAIQGGNSGTRVTTEQQLQQVSLRSCNVTEVGNGQWNRFTSYWSWRDKSVFRNCSCQSSREEQQQDR